jgi:hypothetical protein
MIENTDLMTPSQSPTRLYTIKLQPNLDRNVMQPGTIEFEMNLTQEQVDGITTMQHALYMRDVYLTVELSPPRPGPSQ